MHFRVHARLQDSDSAAHKASGNGSARVSRYEDKVKQELQKAGTKRSHSAPTEADGSFTAQQEPGGPGSNMPRGSVLLLPVASSSAAVQADNSEDVLWDFTTFTTTTTATQTYTISIRMSTTTQTSRSGNIPAVETGTPQTATQHSAHAGSNPVPSPAASTHTNNRPRAATKTHQDHHGTNMTSMARSCCMEMAAGSALRPLSRQESRNAQHPNGDASRHTGGASGSRALLLGRALCKE